MSLTRALLSCEIGEVIRIHIQGEAVTIQQRRWLISIIAVISIVFGLLALGKPYWTLETLPVWLALVVLLLVLWQGSVLHRSVLGVLAVFVAAALLVSQAFSVALLVYGVLAYLAFGGIHALGKIRERSWFTGILGAGLLIFAILGAYWVDVSSIMIGLLIGPLLIVSSVLMLVRVWRDTHRHVKHRSLALTAARVGSVLVLLFAFGTTYLTGKAILGEPELDSFAEYHEPLGDEPGVLLRAIPFERGMPDDTDAMRILYTTTGHDDEIVLATGFVVVPESAPMEPLPVILWTHGTTGIAVGCAPTLLDDPFGSGGLLFHELPLEQGWAIVAPDYLGLGVSSPHPYVVGVPTAQSSLDAVRAARQLADISLSDDTVVWGHSQGGGAALWVGIEQESYAPDVPLLGVAAMAPASNLPGFIDTLMAGPVGPIFGGYILRGYADWYDDVEFNDYVRPGARFSQEKIVERCLSEPSFIANLASIIIREPYTLEDVHAGPLYERLQQNIPSEPTGLPLFIGQGEADPLIVPEAQADFVANLCDAGQVVEYHTYPGRDHMGVVADDSPLLPELMTWTEARFAGDFPEETCISSEN